MKISWYPWQLFFRKWEVFVPIGVGLAGTVGLIIWMYLNLRTAPQPLFLHYSVELGVDEVGKLIWAFVLPGVLFLCLLTNTLLANLFMLNSRFQSRILLWSTLPLVIIFWIWAGLLLSINGL